LGPGDVVRRIPFGELPQTFPVMLQGKSHGRTVVEIAAG
jgi:hypothetical protein